MPFAPAAVGAGAPRCAFASGGGLTYAQILRITTKNAQILSLS